MERKTKKHEWYLFSSIAFATIGSLIISLLFKGEARTYGQLVAVATSSIMGPSDWWRSKSPPVHILVTTGLIVTVSSIILYMQNIFSFQDIIKKLKNSILKLKRK